MIDRQKDRQTDTTNIDRKYRRTEKIDTEIRQIDRIEKTDRHIEKTDIQTEKTDTQTDKETIDRDLEVRICAPYI